MSSSLLNCSVIIDGCLVWVVRWWWGGALGRASTESCPSENVLPALLDSTLVLLRCRSSLRRLLLLTDGHTRLTLPSSLCSLLSWLKGSCRQCQYPIQQAAVANTSKHKVQFLLQKQAEDAGKWMEAHASYAACMMYCRVWIH